MRLRVVVAVLGVVAVACGPSGTGGRRGAGRAGSIAVSQIRSSPRESVPSALDDPDNAGFPKPLLDTAEIISGGPGPDGIPAIDRPRFQRAGQVDWLRDREPVLALELGGQARAYPVQILVWHEIVNDTVADIPIALTYCPLCNTAIAFDRRLGTRVVDFGTSGRLYRSDLVMYDRQTQSMWPQLLGQAVAGVLTGQRLDAFPVSTVSWKDWRAAHPGGLVLSRDTGHPRRYGDNPYPGYDDIGSAPFLFEGKADGRLSAKTRVVGLRAGDDALAVVTDALRRRRVLDVRIGGRTVVVWLAPGTASALDAASVADGREVGATGAFDPAVDGTALHFEPDGDGFRDRETRSRWDVLGRATAGPLAGKQLTAVAHVDTFWFAWAAFLPATRIVS